MDKSIIQEAREALSTLESEAHSLGLRAEYRHELAASIRAGLNSADKTTTPTTPQADGCEWHTDGNGCWMGACGKEFWFEDGGPSDNGMKFCLSCGKPCVEVVDNETGGDQ